MLTAHDFFGLSLHSGLLCCMVVGPSGTAALLGVFQTIQTTFPLCWASRAWVDGVSRRAVLFLLLLISALNWKMMSRLKGTCLVLYATCQRFQHVLYIRHFMATEELREHRFCLQRVVCVVHSKCVKCFVILFIDIHIIWSLYCSLFYKNKIH